MSLNTTYFPGDGAKFHLLVTGITEAQFAEIDRLRPDIVELRDYLQEENIVHSLAHPLFRVNSRVSVEHIEKVLLLFNRFEGINGTRDPRAAELVRAIFRHLTPEMIGEMADRHGIRPVGKTPWIKTFTGGSDDHGGLYVASAWTRTPRAATVEEFLGHLRAGRHEMDGSSGSSLALSHSFYQIVRSYYRQVLQHRGAQRDFVSELFRRLLEPGSPKPALSIGRRVRNGVHSLFFRLKGMPPSSPERILIEEFGKLLDGLRESHRDRDPQWVFRASCRVCHQWAWIAVGQFLERMHQGKFMESLQTLASLGPISLSVIPYIAAFATQHKDESFLQEVARRFEKATGMIEKSDRVAILADGDEKEWERTIPPLVERIRSRGLIPVLVTCREEESVLDLNMRNFAPVGNLEIVENGNGTVFPPFLEVVAYLEERKFQEVVAATPGPMGLIGILASLLLNTRSSAMAAPHLPEKVARMTDDPAFGRITGKYLEWIHDQVDRLYCLDRDEQQVLREQEVHAICLEPSRRQEPETCRKELLVAG